MDQEKLAEKHSLSNPERLINLTDGVFAIILTLLILEVKIPESSSGNLSNEQMFEIFKRLSLYFMSFLLACVYWISHRLLFTYVRYINNRMIWINIVFLMICSLIPFGAALLGHYPTDTKALLFYGCLLVLLAGWRLFMYVYITSKHGMLFAPVPRKRRKRVIGVMIFAQVMFLMSLCLVPLYPSLSLILYAITPPCFTIAITLVNRMPVNSKHNDFAE